MPSKRKPKNLSVKNVKKKDSREDNMQSKDLLPLLAQTGAVMKELPDESDGDDYYHNHNLNHRVLKSSDENDIDEIGDSIEFCAHQSRDEPDETGELFRQYRFECEQLIRTSATMESEKRIAALVGLTRDLIEQNQCLIDNIVEIKRESDARVQELHRRLRETAAQTEAVMLSLASHELRLKQFVEQHCCDCCSCDARLMQFKLCHRDQCWNNHCDEEDNDEQRYSKLCCDLHRHDEWNSVVCRTSNWFASSGSQRFNHIAATHCAHTLPSHIRFTNLVDRIDVRLRQLEAENEEVKHENGLIRQLNSMFSCRNGDPLMVHYRNQLFTLQNRQNVYNISEDDIEDHHQLQPQQRHLDHDDQPQHLLTSHNICLNQVSGKKFDSSDLSEDLITFLGDSIGGSHSATDLLSSYLDDSLDSCGGSRTDSLNGRLDNDSGCSTDLIPSQTDINWLLMSDCDEYCDELDRPTTTTSGVSAAVGVGNGDAKGDTPNSTLNLCSKETSTIEDISRQHLAAGCVDGRDNLRARLDLAERLVPRLYNRLLYYLVQRNALLRQLQHESGARQKCKQDLSTLVDCVTVGLRETELNAKTIAQHRLSANSALF